MTAKRHAARLQISERTVYRDVQDLMLSGVPTEGEAGVHLPPLMFTLEEMEGLITGARLVKAWAGDKLAEQAVRALAKIEHVLPTKLRQQIGDTRIFAPGFHAYARHAAQLDTLRAAINRRQVLEVGYIKVDGRNSERSVRPLGLFFWGSAWTLAAWCELRNDYRNFRIDRIHKIVEAGRRFQETEGISLEALFEK